MPALDMPKTNLNKATLEDSLVNKRKSLRDGPKLIQLLFRRKLSLVQRKLSQYVGATREFTGIQHRKKSNFGILVADF